MVLERPALGGDLLRRPGFGLLMGACDKGVEVRVCFTRGPSVCKKRALRCSPVP